MISVTARHHDKTPVNHSFPGLSQDELQELLNLGRARPGCDCQDPLAAITVAFRSAYRQACHVSARQNGPVVVLDGDSLTLHHNGVRTSLDVTSTQFRALNSLSHAPLAILLLVEGHEEQLLSVETRESVEDLRGQLLLTLTQLGRFGITAEQSQRQAEMLTSCVRFLDAVLAGASTCEATAAFAHEVLPAIALNLTEAVQAKTDVIHARMTAWQQELSAEEWMDLRAVVVAGSVTSHSALGVQYFSQLLGTSSDEPRVISINCALNDDQTMRLAGMQPLDRKVAATFFSSECDSATIARREFLTRFRFAAEY